MPPFPVYKQLDSMDCGPTCLRMIAKYYGKSYSLQFLRSRSYITKSGVSMLGISDAAESIGFRTRGYRLTWEQLRDEVPLPCIVHWRQRHFVVVYAIKKPRKLSRLFRAGKSDNAGNNGKDSSDDKTRVYVADPASGLLQYSKKEFLKCWLSTTKGGEREGTALLLEPTPDFYRQDEEKKGKLRFMYLLGYLRPYRKFIAQLFLGMMMAVQYIIGQLNAPIQQFIGFTQQAQDARISLERLGEIHDRDDEERPEDNKIQVIPSEGTLEVKNLLFQYEGPHSEKVLNNINLEIPARKVTAIVGTSGSGKTTLIKLLLGFYQPVEGEITLNGTRLDRYSQREWRKKCGVVMQEGFIFSDSISGNIGVIDDFPDKGKLEKAVTTANIKEFIESLPLGYETNIGGDGHGISTGQKQRLLIARSVYKDPDYLFFDEATNSLDAKNERVIMENLDRFFVGRTVVIVAHRLSTVKKADQIIVLEKGEIIETGNIENQRIKLISSIELN